MKKIIETERLILRPFTIDDLDEVYQLNLDPEISRYTMDGGPYSKADLREMLTKTTLADYKKYGYGRMAVIYKTNNEFIGFSGLKYLDDMDEVDIGYRYKKAYWGMGIATEAALPFLDVAFQDLGLQQIIGMVHPDNKASTNVLKKLGFQFREYLMEDGVQVECYQLSR